MIFDPESICRIGKTLDQSGSAPFSVSGGLWLCCLSRGRCVLTADSASSFLLRPGELLLARGALFFAPVEALHLIGIQLVGSVVSPIESRISAPLVQDSALLPGMAERLSEFCASAGGVPPASCFGLLCRLAGFDAVTVPMPRLAAEAIALIRKQYAQMYGVEELAEALGVSKSHLVRSFRAATGKTPGQYLTEVRIEAAKQLLGAEDCGLELIAQLTGFSGANYLCRVFRQSTGTTPTAYRAALRSGSTGENLVSGSIYL